MKFRILILLVLLIALAVVVSGCSRPAGVEGAEEDECPYAFIKEWWLVDPHFSAEKDLSVFCINFRETGRTEAFDWYGKHYKSFLPRWECAGPMEIDIPAYGFIELTETGGLVGAKWVATITTNGGAVDVVPLYTCSFAPEGS